MHRARRGRKGFRLPSRDASADYPGHTALLVGSGGQAIVRPYRCRSRHGGPAQANRASAKDSPVRCLQVNGMALAVIG